MTAGQYSATLLKRRSILEFIPHLAFDMVDQTRAQLEEMVFRAKTFVAEGQERIVAQQARVAALDRQGARAHESKRLLKAMEITQSLQISHLDMLRRALHEKDCVASSFDDAS